LDLLERFPNVVLPGVLCDNKKWIGAETKDMPQEIRAFYVDQMLASPTSVAALHRVRGEITFHPEGESEHSETLDEEDEGEDLGDFCTVITENRERYNNHEQQQLQEPDHSIGSAATTWTANVRLPNHDKISVPDLTRRLYQALEHNYYQEDGRTYCYVTGNEMVPLLRQALVHLGDSPSCKTSLVIQFGQLLVQRGMLRSYTPSSTDFLRSFFALQPLFDTRVLNSFVQWPKLSIATPTADVETEDAMDVILRLSHQMDDMCASLSQSRDITAAFEQFEVAVCQLQRVNFPVRNVEHVAFAINLFNLIVRHAMILTILKRNVGFEWPSTLLQLDELFNKIGYQLANEWVCASKLQLSLFGYEEDEDVKTGIKKPTDGHKKSQVHKKTRNILWSRLRQGRNRRQASKEKVNPHRPAIRTDHRILFAIGWGTPTSPTGLTVYPNRLKESMQSAAEAFCQQNIEIHKHLVVLPRLLEWHATDFCEQPSPRAFDVLKAIMPYLSPSQLKQIRNKNVAFEDSFDWSCGPRIDKPARPSLHHLRDALVRGKEPSFCPRTLTKIIPEVVDETEKSEMSLYYDEEEDYDVDSDSYFNDRQTDAQEPVPAPPTFQANVSALTMGSEFFHETPKRIDKTRRRLDYV